MKKLILMSVLMFVLSIASYGQLEKGNYLLGGTGTMDFSSNERLNERRTSFGIEINPNLGYFVTNKLALTASIPLRFGSSKVGTWKSRGISYGLAPGLRYYFVTKEKSALFASTSFGLFQSKSKSESNTSLEVDRTSILYSAATVSLGYVYFLNKNIGLETTLGYNRTKSGDNKPYSYLKLNVGFQIYFGGRA